MGAVHLRSFGKQEGCGVSAVALDSFSHEEDLLGA